MNFQHLTGPYFDSICQSAGLRNTRLRTVQGQEVRPSPLLSHLGQVGSTDIGFQLEDTELLDTWESSIPQQTLKKSLGSNWQTKIGPDQLWQINDGNGWKLYRTFGQPQYSNADAGDRVKLVFKADVNEDNTLGFEAPYVP